MFKGTKVTFEKLDLNPKDFTNKELNRIDCEGLSRQFIKINWSKVDDNTVKAVNDIVKHQYKLPMKFIECVDYTYRSVKRNNEEAQDVEDGKNKSEILSDYLYIEPLNNNYSSYIRYIPINQALPLDTNIVIDIDEIKMHSLDPNYYFMRSNSMQTDANIESIIKKAKPSSYHLKPWLNSVHIGSLDIDSKFYFKGKVALMNADVCNSLCLFGFKRDDDHNFFEIYTFNCFNISPKEIFEMMLEQPDINEPCKELCKYVIANIK